MISVSEALDRMLALVEPFGTEEINTEDAGGRVLRAPIKALRDQPPFAASAMDGYALRRADIGAGNVLEVIATQSAGEDLNLTLGNGQSIRIFTGAPIPAGADFVLMQEDADRSGDKITIRDTFEGSDFIRPAGGDFRKGEELTSPRLLTPTEIALSAAMGHAKVTVSRKPVIALLPTGDELVWPGENVQAAQIVSSNNFGLKALLESRGASVRMLPIAHDNADSLEAGFAAAAGADLLVTLGGASVGEKDLIREVGAQAGLQLDFYKVAMRPGKPLMAGRLNGMPMIGLPGNPVSALVCGHVFLRPMLERMLGLAASALPRRIARLTHDLPSNGNREHYMRATVTDGQCTVHQKQDSSLLSVLAKSNALAVQPAGDQGRALGDEIEFIEL